MILLQLLAVIILLLGLIIFSSHLLFDVWASIKGAPFVPTRTKLLKEIFDRVELKRGQQFLELGSGDGRVTRFAVKEYQVEGVGFEINYILVQLSKLLAQIQHLKNIHFQSTDFFKEDFSRYNTIFLFLMPSSVKKLKSKFLKECPKGTVIISHGFEIKEMARLEFDQISRKSFSTYYYRIR